MVDAFANLIRRHTESGEHGVLIVVVGDGHFAATSRFADGAYVAHRDNATSGQLMIVGDAESASAHAWHIANDLAADRRLRIAVCNLGTAIDSQTSIERALRVDEVLAHPANPIALGLLRPRTEVLVAPGSTGDRRGAEDRARGLVERGDLVGAGFVAGEIDEPVEDRVRWLGGLVEVAREIAPSSAAVGDCAQLFAGWSSDKLDMGETREVFNRLRDEILDLATVGGADERALYVAELSTKTLHNLTADATTADHLFDRDTPWWLVRSCLTSGSERERSQWLNALFPLTSGRF